MAIAQGGKHRPTGIILLEADYITELTWSQRAALIVGLSLHPF
jgi:hypothetical protein